MQLHLLENKPKEPFLLQMLWGRLISVVIYKKKLVRIPACRNWIESLPWTRQGMIPELVSTYGKAT